MCGDHWITVILHGDAKDYCNPVITIHHNINSVMVIIIIMFLLVSYNLYDYGIVLLCCELLYDEAIDIVLTQRLAERWTSCLFAALYGLAIGLYVAPGDFASYVDIIKSLELSPIILFPAKTIVAFPLVYHYLNGIRHLVRVTRTA